MSTSRPVPTSGHIVSYRLTNIPPELYQAYVFETIGGSLSLIPYGIAVSLFISCVKSLVLSLRQAGPTLNTRPKLLHMTYLCLIFTMGSIFTASGVWILVYLRLEYPLYPGGPLGWELDHYSHPIINLGNSAYILASWFSDGFMMYRCCIIYGPGISIVLLLPGLLYLASLASGTLLLCRTSLPHESLFSQINFGLLNFSIAASLNILLTVMISGRLYAHRLRMQRLLGVGHSPLRIYTSVIGLLIESSAIHSAFSLLFIIPFSMGHPLSQFSLMLLGQVQVISPLLVSYRITQRKAWTRSTAHDMNTLASGIVFDAVQSKSETQCSVGTADG
ncbi:hypothetical protein D9611_002152 [Ephemerocybe angulata]|uniref:Uncharacterized protein n=1 Tax=Ephemerocybe angulata TaxID=980116 RepID=A0A8H5CI61_9AGAR|nr:hypothetical protein D9611_002152 [Tulosesus angulatus]